ncbi:rho GTPase-activating protein 6 [Grus japonensis]|uniref:Rho GTPase-activating protein 6 n=1 Tax=Grus japonensis TaxID=30415 RepID=A0ABC9VZ13_GRUJA
MSAQSLLSSVFSCSSPAAAAPVAAKSLSKRRLRQTRSLDPAIIGGGREDGEGVGRSSRSRAAGSPPGDRHGSRGAPPPPGASFSTPSTPLERSPPGSALFDEESPRGKRSPGWELPFLTRTPSASALSGPAGPANSIFSSPRRWLQQRKGQPSSPGPRPAAYVVWKSEFFDFSILYHKPVYWPRDGKVAAQFTRPFISNF